ncbi:MAG: hypothetical protein AAFN13_09325, partial [Bacteroidota bacterium]
MGSIINYAVLAPNPEALVAICERFAVVQGFTPIGSEFDGGRRSLPASPPGTTVPEAFHGSVRFPFAQLPPFSELVEALAFDRAAR